MTEPKLHHLTIPLTALVAGSLSEYLFNNYALAQAEALLTKAPPPSDLIVWNLTQETWREQVQVAIEWILREN